MSDALLERRQMARPRPSLEPEESPFRLRVGRSRIHGWGVFALDPIPALRKVIEYKGARVSVRKANERRRKAPAVSKAPRVSTFRVNRYWVVDGDRGGNGAVLINHSCDPNLRTRVIRGQPVYFSRRRIRKGEELCVDYRFRWKKRLTPCHCGSTRCRGTINLPPFLPPRGNRAVDVRLISALSFSAPMSLG